MIITVANIKGGVGKSTISCNLAVEGAKHGKKVLLVDSDTQGSSVGWRATREKDDIKATSIVTPTLHKDLPAFREHFDLIVVDAGGRESNVFRSAIMAADLIIIPITPSQYDIWATADTIAAINDAAVYKDIKAKFLFNQVISGTKIATEAMDALQEIKAGNGHEIMGVKLYSRVAFKNAVSRGLGVTELEPGGKAASEIEGMYNEIVKGGEE